MIGKNFKNLKKIETVINQLIKERKIKHSHPLVTLSESHKDGEWSLASFNLFSLVGENVCTIDVTVDPYCKVSLTQVYECVILAYLEGLIH